MSERCITPYGGFSHWWAVLPAIPPSTEEVDWWAPDRDKRTSPYKRLWRVWADPTRLLKPKDDPLRPHEFASPSHGTHLLCKTWENFVLFHPSDWVPRFLSLAGMSWPGDVADCAWSYEYEAMVGNTTRFKLADAVLHVRQYSGRELLVVVEAKRPGDKLKEDSDLPDTSPSSYLDREAFAAIEDRRLIYLVDAAYASVVRQKVTPSDRRWGIVTWAQLAELQHSLCMEILPPPLCDFLAVVLASTYAGPGFTGIPAAVVRHMNKADAMSEGPALARWRAALKTAELPEYLRHYVDGALQYMECRSGRHPEVLAAPYLASEPSFQAVHRQPKAARQTTPQRREPLWRLPALQPASTT